LLKVQLLSEEMTSNYRNRARAFREAMDQPMDCFTPAIAKLQLLLITEEWLELKTAIHSCIANPTNRRAKEEALKELTDLMVVVFQMAEAFGWDLDSAYNRVMDSNMSKLVDGKPLKRDDGKVLKGPNYHPPVLIDFV
jgi:NTP pyrophosphatase (non-canonical NTP hydrolase)